MSSVYTIVGDKDSGKYVVTENNNVEPLFEVTNKHYGGLKEARQRIGQHLMSKGYSLTIECEHRCVKQGRKNNPLERWTVEEYLIGVPLKSKKS
jgi:hypothetical protein